MEYEIYNDGELTHWGIKGMRWGIRRYQNKDGSLTNAGKRRIKKETEALKKEEEVLKNRKATKAKFDRLAAKRKTLEEKKKELDSDDEKNKSDAPDKTTKKSYKDMDDIELANTIRRIQMEKQYESLTAQPEIAKKGNSFVKDFWDKSAVPAIQEAGKGLIKDSLTKLGKKYLGLNESNADDYVTKLGKEVKKMTLEKQYKKLKEEFEAETAKAAAKEEAKASRQSDDKVYEGTVEGVGKSSQNTKKGKEYTRNSTIIDADYYEVVNDSNTSSGRSYMHDYLALPGPRALPAPKDDD